MNKWSIIIVLVLVFVAGSLLVITNFTTLSGAKWSDNGLDMLYGIVLIILFGFLIKAHDLNKNKNILIVSIGFLILAFSRILEIFLQEYQISIDYTPVPDRGWALSYSIVLVGIIFVIKGLLGVKKK